MNKNQRLLTAVALAVFGVIIALHYMSYWVATPPGYRPPNIIPYRSPPSGSYVRYIEDVRMPIFVLGVFYVGLFFMLQDKKTK